MEAMLEAFLRSGGMGVSGVWTGSTRDMCGRPERKHYGLYGGNSGRRRTARWRECAGDHWWVLAVNER